MYQVKIRMVGLAPLRMNKFTDSALSGGSRKKSKQEYIEEAHLRSYKDDKGYYVPKDAVKACIVNGGKKVKVGRGAASQLLKAIFHLDNPKVYLDKKFKAEVMEGVVRIPPKTGSRVMQYWVVFPKWEIEFTATVIDDRFPVKSLQDACNEAGIYYGLLDGRPDYGRFVVEEFKKL